MKWTSRLPGVLLLACAVTAAASERAGSTAAVETSSGKPVQLSSLLGRPTVLFYEDKDSTELNQRLKDELFARGRARGLLGAANVVAIADLKAFDWFPARNFARAGVRDAEKKAGVPVFIDWQGALSGPPWHLPAKTSSVLVLSPSGEVLFSFAGALPTAKREELFRVLESQIVSAQEPARGG